MDKISFRAGILAAGLIMALSPSVLLAEDLMTPTEVQTSEEMQKAKQEQKREQATDPAGYKEIQDIPDPKNLNTD